MGQGANQAMQDGYLIGRYLSENGEDYIRAFEEFYKVRHPVTVEINNDFSSNFHSNVSCFIFGKKREIFLVFATIFIFDKKINSWQAL